MQCLQIERLLSLHHDLCRRSPIHRSAKHHRHLVQQNTKGSSAETHRRPNSGIDHALPWSKHITQGNYIDISLNTNYVDIILEESGMTTCSPSPSPGVSHMKATTEDAQAACWQDTAASVHTARHQLWSKGTSKITTSTSTT